MSLINFKQPNTMIYAFVGLAIGVAIVVALLPNINTSLGNLSTAVNSAGLPFASLFASGGIMYILLAVAVLVGVLALLGFGKGKGR